MKLIYVSLMIALSGCATKISQEALNVRVLRKSDPPADCREVGNLSEMVWLDREEAIKKLREDTARIGGNTLYVHTQVGYQQRGVAYMCSDN